MTPSQPGNSDENAESRSALLRVLGAIDHGLSIIERVIIAGGVLAMAVLMSGQVVGNLLFEQGIPGTYEVTEMLIVVITFVGVGYAARNARHISMSAIYDQLSGRWRKALLILISLGTAVLMFYFADKSIDYVMAIHDRGRSSASLNIPMWIVYLALPIGFILAGVQYLLTTVRNLVSDDIYRSFNEKEEYNEVPPEAEEGNGSNEGHDARRDT